MKLRRIATACVIGLVLGTATAVAQEPPGAPAEAAAPPKIDRQEIQAALDALTATEQPDDGTRAQAVKTYEDALAAIQRAEEAMTRAASHRTRTDEAPQLREAIRAELEKPYVLPEITRPPDATLQSIEQQLAQATTELAAERTRAEELQAESQRRGDRRSQIPDEITKARAELAEIETAILAKADAAVGADLVAARTALLRARRAAVSASIAALEAELASYDARRELLPARRDQAARRVADAENRVKAWQALANQERATAARAAEAQAAKQTQEAERRHEVLERFAARSESLTRLRTGSDSGTAGLTKLIEATTKRASTARSRVAALRLGFQSVRRRIDVSGLNRATGLILRREYEALASATKLRSWLRAITRDLEDAEYALIEHEEARLGANDIDRVTQSLLTEIEAAGTAPATREQLEPVARRLAIARRDIIDELVADAATYRDALVELDTAMRELLAVTEAYQTFIEERILWVRSFAMDRFPQAEDFRATFDWLFRPASWTQVLKAVAVFLSDQWAICVVGALGVLVAFGLSLWARIRSRHLATVVAKYRTDAFHHSVEALAWALIGAIPIPLFVWCVGQVLTRAPDSPDVGLALGSGLEAGSYFLLSFWALRHVFGAKGLAGAHFRWPEEANAAIRRNFEWFIPTLFPIIVLVVGLDRHGGEDANASVGRIAFSVGLLATAVFLVRLLRPAGPVMSEYLRRYDGGWLDRLRHVGFPAVVGLPIALIVATWAGYYYTAQQIEDSLRATFLLVGALVTLNGMLLRWLFLARRQVAFEDARRRRDEARVAAEGSSSEPSESTAPIDVAKLDLPAISGQTRQLFLTAIFFSAMLGFFAIWAETLPALQILDRLQVWPEMTILDSETGESPDALETRELRTTATAGDPGAGATRTATPSAQGAVPGITGNGTATEAAAPAPADALSVTVADIGLALLLLIATVVAFRNLPGLVEITVLKRLPLDSGSRYALSTVLRYAIAIIGIIFAFSALSISWSRIQWLAAALTFGLAFGLQEIFANFVSGLIILAERPFRIGDTVTVADVSGTVSRIRMRATTIVDWDRKELVIPNKDFITGRVINWTLTDSVLRVKVPVGVSYGSDVDKVETILLDVAKKVDRVLEDPKPQALFLGFGDSTLNFEVRVFIPHIDHLLSVRHALHRDITKAFREANIEIAFPQRDLHVRSIGDLAKLVDREDVPEPEKEAWAQPE